jgi:hypothetical protein
MSRIVKTADESSMDALTKMELLLSRVKLGEIKEKQIVQHLYLKDPSVLYKDKNLLHTSRG